MEKLGSNLFDSLPVLGYVKATVHFACGNKEGGYKALVSATRSLFLLVAGEAAKGAGPAGCVLAAVGTGACYDLAAAALSDGRHVKGLARIRADNSWGRGGTEILGDVICGMSNLVDANKEPWKTMMKNREENAYQIDIKNGIFMWGLLIRAAGGVNDLTLMQFMKIVEDTADGSDITAAGDSYD